MPTLSRNIVISLMLAVLAAAALIVWTNQVRSQAAHTADAVSVIVATHDVPAGTSVADAKDHGYLAFHTVRQADLAGGAVRSWTAVENEVVTSDLFTGDQLTASRVGPLHEQGVAFQVQGNERAIRVPLGADAGLLADVAPGDHVDVFTNYKSGSQVVTYAAVRAARVLAVTPPPASSVAGANQGALTLAVSDTDAMWLANALANKTGTGTDPAIWIALDPRAGATESKLDSPLMLPSTAKSTVDASLAKAPKLQLSTTTP